MFPKAAAAPFSPDDPSPHWRLGRCYQSMGRGPEAKAEFVKTRNLNEAKQQSLREQMDQIEAKQTGHNVNTEAR